jgi:hypothetical protein
MLSTAMLQTNVGTFLNAASSAWMLSGICLRGDHQHRDGEGEGCVDERFQSRHLHSAQTKPAEPGQRIQIYRQRRRYLFMPLVHRGLVMPYVRPRWQPRWTFEIRGQRGQLPPFRAGSVMRFLFQCRDHVLKPLNVGRAHAPNYCSFEIG